MSKDEKCTCKACKNPVFHCQICKFVGFLLPSSSWLLKLPVVSAIAHSRPVRLLPVANVRRSFTLKKYSSEFFRGNFPVISQFYALVYLAFAKRGKEPLLFWVVFCILATSRMYLRSWASQNANAGRVLQVIAVFAFAFVRRFTAKARRGSSNTCVESVAF